MAVIRICLLALIIYIPCLAFAQPADPATLAQLRFDYGKQALLKSDFELALEEFRQSFVLYEKELGEIKWEAITEIARIYRMLGEYQKSHETIDDGLSKIGSDTTARALLLDEKAFTALLEGDYATTRNLIDQSSELKAEQTSLDKRFNWRIMGLLLLKNRQLPRSKYYLDKSLSLGKQDADSLHIAKLLHDLGMWYSEVNDLEEAQTAFREALLFFKALPGQQFNAGQTNVALGTAFLLQGEHGKASVYYEDALSILEPILSDQHYSLLPVYNGLGRSFLEIDEPLEARLNFEKAHDLASLTYGEHHHHRVNAYLNIALAHLAENNPQHAYQKCQTALASLQQQNIFESKRLKVKALQMMALARLYQFETSNDEGFLVEARNTCKEAIELVDQVVLSFYSDHDRLGLIRDFQSVYEVALAVERAAIDFPDYRQEAVRKAFFIMERSKAHVLKTRVRQSQYPLSRLNDPAMSRMLKRLHLLSGQLDRLSANDQLFEAVRDSLLDTELQLETAFTRLRPAAVKVEQWDDLPEMATIQQKLDRSSAMLSYYLQDSVYHILYLDQSRAEWLVYPVNQQFDSGVRVKEPGKMKVLGGILAKKKNQPPVDVGGFPTQITNLQPQVNLHTSIDVYQKAIKKVDKRSFVQSSLSLYNKLIFPISAFLEDKDHLIIIPHRELHMVPFEGLLTKAVSEQKLPKYSKMDYLISDYAISYHYSAELFELIRDREARQKEAQQYEFLGFAPVFNDTLRAGWVWNSQEFMRDTTYFGRYSNASEISSQNQQYRELQYSEDEVLDIAKIFARNGGRSQVFLHGQATESNLKEQAKRAKVLHIASHSFVDLLLPEQTGVAFAEEASQREDGILYKSEIFGLDLSAELVVLSSCESGVGPLTDGEGVMSLARGFLYAGADKTLVSLWRIPDRLTSEFMVDFYQKYLGRNRLIPFALQEAKLKAIQNEKTALPRNWCSFILIGH